MKISRLLEKREEKIKRYCHAVVHSAIATLRKRGLTEKQAQDVYERFAFIGTVVLWDNQKNKKEKAFLSRLPREKMLETLKNMLSEHLRRFYSGCSVSYIIFRENNEKLIASFEMRRY